MAEFITAGQAAKLIPDGATVGVAGMGLSGWPEEVAVAIADCFRETGHPCNLTMKQGSAMGDWKERGMTRLGCEGLVTKWSAAHIGSAFAMNDLVRANKMACHCLPQGIIVNLWREIAAHRPGLLSKVGLGTFVDPRLEGGKMNEVTSEELVELVNFNGEEYLFYKAFPLDVALLRGTTADEDGNITFEKEGPINEGLAVAQAAKNSGGIVIVQVEYRAKRGTMHPKEVKIPGALVDYVVEATDINACWQTEGVYYEPSFAGNLKKPIDALPVLPLNERKIIERRCAMELRKGNLVNLGVGIPADVASVVAEEGCTEDIILTTESGNFGGVPAALPNFGSSYNPQASIDHGSMFDFYDGGGIDVAVLGLAQSDKQGNINVSKFYVPGFGYRLTGPGGFINISQNSKKVIFAGTFMAKCKEEIKDGKLVITQEGKGKKFLEEVEQVTFSGSYAAKSGQEILYVTERCVFKLIDGVMTLTEIAPGIEIERDILPHMDFTPAVSPELKLMNPDIFQENWGGLKDFM
ncbi:acyl CoA:acetate/3-ketoacid CoA transferase [Murimonas intestini]|uniref:Propionate CoA-transferase n=1 Tax=Murimonas intestini TaxID=1337051 RepID=A0AB73T8S5_9FIRM|nr:CoA-transferase [Murimonas intestini]MCR1839966.1 acyl CoA:acetate/3-ketoacid CoA transferase [Murimonas intestini]MCR1866806.1 acyl CoA:acetate/3-ketoacid CoA transferase [Murimonas intestini]MCR1883639.1 acyl CoA:acetate/3-ketoacid CoA transferase [Murimonas intestini]